MNSQAPDRVLAITPEEIAACPDVAVEILEDDAALSRRFADEMVGRIEEGNRLGSPASFILPVGPRGGYPVFVDEARRRSLDLSRTTFFFMDEYVGPDGRHIPQDHPLSFRGFVKMHLVDRLSGHPGFEPGRVHFPDPGDPGGYGRLIREAGGIDLALCGVGIDGHVAFNEPRQEMEADAYARLSTRIVDLTCETRTVNAVMEAGGAIDLVPRRAVTVGMAEIMAARRVVVFMNRGWQRAAVREFLFGEITAGFPVSLLRRHAGLTVVATGEVCAPPLD
jgi:glucosamine-6-phosphate deaminase